MSELTSRRVFLIALLAASFIVKPALAKDGDSEGGSDNNGSGSDNSGSGSDTDSDDDDEDENDKNSGQDRSHREERRKDDQDKAIKAVRRGKAVSLKELKGFLKQHYPGKVLDVTLRKSSGMYFYNVRILAKGNRIRALTLNALTLKPRVN